MNMLELSEARFSARKFTDEPVSDADLHYVLECARLAPSAVNRQPWKLVVVRSPEARQQLWSAYDREWFRTAPLYIVCMRNNQACWTRRYDDKPHGDIDVAIATEHLCLAATERGLGTCWVCNYDPAVVRNLFRLPIMRPWPSFPWAMWPPTAHAQRRNANPWRRSLRSGKPSPLPANLSSQPQLSKLRQRVGLDILGLQALRPTPWRWAYGCWNHGNHLKVKKWKVSMACF